jgi:hypothetical protein
MTAPLHVVEPTLADATGHCYSFLEAFCRASGEHPIAIWGARDARVSFPRNVKVNPFFRRRIRRLQEWWLLRRLLRQPGRIFVSTAGRSDLVLLDLAARGRIPPGKAVLYVHWFRETPSKARQLARLAARQPEIAILAPTESACAVFREAGFPHVRQVPYPVAPEDSEAVPEFHHVLCAGAARSDKGIAEVVSFVALLAKSRSDLPVRLQTSAQHYEKTDAATAASLRRLEAIGYPHLIRIPDTLAPAEYRAQFRGAVCLQLYDRGGFADRVSGVTLDALREGAPIVTLSGTWMARVVEESGAGIALAEPAPEPVLEAVLRLREGYADYHRRAWTAGRELCKRNDAGRLFREVTA